MGIVNGAGLLANMNDWRSFFFEIGTGWAGERGVGGGWKGAKPLGGCGEEMAMTGDLWETVRRCRKFLLFLISRLRAEKWISEFVLWGEGGLSGVPSSLERALSISK